MHVALLIYFKYTEATITDFKSPFPLLLSHPPPPEKGGRVKRDKKRETKKP